MTTFNTPGFACLAALLALALLPGTAKAEPLVTAPRAATDTEAAELKSKLETGIARAFLSGMSDNDGTLASSQAEMPSALGDPLAENLVSKMFVRLATKASAELA